MGFTLTSFDVSFTIGSNLLVFSSKWEIAFATETSDDLEGFTIEFLTYFMVLKGEHLYLLLLISLTSNPSFGF